MDGIGSCKLRYIIIGQSMTQTMRENLNKFQREYVAVKTGSTQEYALRTNTHCVCSDEKEHMG